MGKKLKEGQIQEIISLYQDGVPPKEIGEKFNIKNNSVTRILRKREVPRNQATAKTSEEKIKIICNEYKKGVSSEVIAKKLGINGTTVCRILKKNDIKIRPATKNKKKQNNQDTKDYIESKPAENKTKILTEKEIFSLYKDGLNYDEISKKTTHSYYDIQNIIKNQKQIARINEIINQAKEIHGNRFDYSETNEIIDNKIPIICKTHGKFFQNYHSHLKGHGCSKCGKQQMAQKQRKTTEQIIREFKETHGDKFDYSKIKYKSAHYKVEIICHKHGVFWQTPHDHLKSQGCPNCRGEKISQTKTKDLNDFIQEAKKVHLNKYTYDKANYQGNKTNLTITCHQHGDFLQSPNAHLRGQGCPNCWLDRFSKENPSKNPEVIHKIHLSKKLNKSYGKSKIEDAFYDFLCYKFGKLNIKRQFIINNKAIDFFITKLDLYIQIDGVYYHGLDRPLKEIEKFKTKTDENIYQTILRDRAQNKWFKEQKIPLVRVSDKSLKEFFNNQVFPKPHFLTENSTELWNNIFTNHFQKPLIINNKTLTAKNIKTLNEKEREALIEPIFSYIRKIGWQEPDFQDSLLKELERLKKYQPDISVLEVNNNNSIATNICKHFCSSFYSSVSNKNRLSIKKVWESDELLKKVIKNRLVLNWVSSSQERFSISPKSLIQGMRSMGLVAGISIFKPSIAKYMAIKYSQPEDVIADYSAGWGARLLGTAITNRKYIGIDPLTTPDLQKMVDYFNFNNCKLISGKSEEFKDKENSADLVWSSPPYFNQEIYSFDESQAYSKGEDYFYNVYWKQTLENMKYILKPNKWFGVNIKNCPKMLSIAEKVFGEVQEKIGLVTQRSHLARAAGATKTEYIYMFKNNK